jgi:hypothetical protein
MNEEQEMLVRQSKWSGRRVVLFYWFAIIFLGTSAAVGLGTTVLAPSYKVEAADPHAGIYEPWHPDDCVACHPDEVGNWSETWHATMVGEYVEGNDALNGSRMSYNSTHFWRTPKTPANESDLTDMSNIQYWTYNQIFNASGQQCCMTTRWGNVTVINATTGATLWVTNDTKLENWTSNIWDIGVSCAACHDEPGEVDLSYRTCSGCHTPGGRQWMGYVQSEHYNSLDDLLASGGINSLTGDLHYSYVGQSTYMDASMMNVSDYYTITCVTCHDPHDASINWGDTHLNDNFQFSPYTNPYTGEVFGKNGSQLRAATVNDLCGNCHEISLNTTVITGSYFLDPTDHEDLACTDCHGYTYSPEVKAANGTVTENSSVSSLNHNWVFGGDGNDCGVCHDENASTVWATWQAYVVKFGNLTDAKASYATNLAAATAKYEEAKSTPGVDIDKLANAWALIEEAKDLAEPSERTFHNPEQGVASDIEKLALAVTKLKDAVDEATDAIPEPTTTECSSNWAFRRVKYFRFCCAFP